MHRARTCDARNVSLVAAEPEDAEDDAVLHRLCPTYAQDINSPFRHVRTRIYFTSESHMHSLLNVLRFCQLGKWDSCSKYREEQGLHSLQEHDLLRCRHLIFTVGYALLLLHWCPAAGQEGEPPLLGEEGQRVLHDCRELDYMTHIVLRMFENTT